MPGNRSVKIIECPRDAMQGWPNMIPANKKIIYINELFKVGFDTLDVGSFVSAKAIPQMADTREVITSLNKDRNGTNLLAIVANTRGANEALLHEEISYLGFPLSISETFQLRNTNASITSGIETIKEIQELCLKNNRSLVVYISMAFGNPYGDIYHQDIVSDYVSQMISLEIPVISVADTIGIATSQQISDILPTLITTYPSTEFGVHLHSVRESSEKIDAALEAGCRRFDGAIKGIGGCPMAGNELVGNMDTEYMTEHFISKGFDTGLNREALRKCSLIASDIFI
ncbi:MAG: hydroxymethylglutaryl-CoA lyase [Ferruginibacter sp.]